MELYVQSSWRLPVLSGLLLVLAFYSRLLVPNFVAFLPVLLWLDTHSARPLRETAKAALVFGLTAYGVGLHWCYAMLSISWLAVLMYLALVVLFTSGATAAITLVGWCRRSTGWPYGILLPVCWLPFEWSRNWGDLRITADHVGQSLAPYPFLIQFDDLVGPYGVGAFLLASNGLLFDAFRGWRGAPEGAPERVPEVTPEERERWGSGGRRPAIALGFLVVVVLLYDGWAWTHPPAESGRLRVALVQPNIPLVLKHDPEADAEQLEVLTRLTLEAARQNPDLIVWPESARPQPLHHWLDNPRTFAMPDVQRLAAETGATLLTGVDYARIRTPSEYEAYNAALVVHPDGRLDPAWTAKVYLVPFTEGIPFRAVLGPVLGGLRGGLHWLAGGFTPGPESALLPVGPWKAGVLVCYEQLYFDLARRLRNAGAQLQVVITNDAWFGRTVFQSFQADVVRMRAIENRCAFIRAANTGISGFVDPLGRYHGRTRLFVPAVEVHDVPITDVRTVYDRIGDAVAWLAIAGLGVTVIVARRSRRSRRRGPPGPQARHRAKEEKP